MPDSRTSSAIALIALILFTSCGDRPENESQKPFRKLKIEYFSSTVSNHYGYASLKAGVEAALAAPFTNEANSPDRIVVSNYVEFEPRSDQDSQDKAEAAAREIRRDPDVLAVIGQAASGTTFAALPLYAEAGIPVIIPNATSPYVLYRHSFDPNSSSPRTIDLDYSLPRFSNAFRLIPSDVPDQAHAMELTIKKVWHEMVPGENRGRAKVLLVCDATEDSGAGIYSKPICDYLDASENKNEGGYDVVGRTDLDKRVVASVLPEIHATDPNFIVVASYSSLARLVLQVWREDNEKRPRTQPKNAQHAEPRFIMPDACLSPELLKSDARIYVTYPMNPRHIDGCPSKETFRRAISCQKEKQLGKPQTDCEPIGSEQARAQQMQSSPSIDETDEMFAYDSVIILKSAVKQCIEEQDLNRACILRYLNNHHDALRGICETYHVEHGDRQNAYYYVYEKVRNEGNTKKKRENEYEWVVKEFAKNDDHDLNTYSNDAR
jgi:hypothetical protein